MIFKYNSIQRRWSQRNWLGFHFISFLHLSIFSFSYLFAAEIDLVLLWVFQPNFWVFLCIFQAPVWADHSDLGINGKTFPPAEVEYRWCKFRSKVMMSEVKQKPTLVTASYSQHKSQNWNPNFAEFLVFFSLLWIDSPNLSQKDSLLKHLVTWLTHWLLELSAKNTFFGHFADFQPGNGPN